jgi:hypothetical protein
MPPKKQYLGPCDYALYACVIRATRPARSRSRFRPAAKLELAGKQVCPNADCQFWGWGGNRDTEKEKAAAAGRAAKKKQETDAAAAALAPYRGRSGDRSALNAEA